MSPRLTPDSPGQERFRGSELASRVGHALARGAIAATPGIVRSAPVLWTTFAVAWLVVLVITAAMLVREPLAPWRLTAMIADLALLALLYLWLTLRAAPSVGEPMSDRDRDVLSLRARVTALVAMTTLVVPLVALAPAAGMWWHVMYAVVAAGLALPTASAVAAIVALLVFALVGARVVAGHADPRLVIQLAIGGAAIAVRHLTLTVEELRVAREALAHRAVDEERLRIARDLHDLLGHSLSLISIKGELAGRLLPDSPAEAAREVHEIERAARDALRQVRTAVIGYRQPTLRGELAAARELLSAAGVHAVIVDDAGPLPAAADGLLAWTVREAVTNVIRHSRARSCEIRATRCGDRASVSVIDDGRGTSMPAPSAGSGLTGLRERATAAAACLTTGPSPGGGFRVALDVAVDAPHARPEDS